MSVVNWSSINLKACLAPMVGLSHIALRMVIQSYLPDDCRTIWPSEMLNSRRLPNEDFIKTPELGKSNSDFYFVPQILGNEEKPIQNSIKKLKDWGAHGIDINMGCPVQKALKHNYGVALMGDLDYACRVVEMAACSSDLPVSVKLRAIKSDQSQYDLNHFVERLVNAGAKWITLHPRTPEQQRRGWADWNQVYELKSSISVPVIGNGDIQTIEDYELRIKSGVDMVMIGRALAAKPWLLGQIAESNGLKSAKYIPKNEYEEAREYGLCLEQLCQNLLFWYGNSLALRKLQFYLRMTTPWLEWGHHYIGLAQKAQSIEHFLQQSESLRQIEQRMYQRTDLRI